MTKYNSHPIAWLLKRIGVKPKYSTGICGNVTVGYGRLSDYGYWRFMLDIIPSKQNNWYD